jgi:hypothetical protein
MHAADETSFNRLALKARLPVIALFHGASCELSRAALAGLARVAALFEQQVQVVTVDGEANTTMCEQLGVWALPSYILLHRGDELTRVCGFLPAGLLRCLFELGLESGMRLPQLWRPSEQQFEDAVLLPMLQAWGWDVRRQERCAVGRGRNGVIDVLVFSGEHNRPVTLFENKRLIANDDELRRAAAQARRYAQSLQAPSFVVADPLAVWVYGAAGDAPRARFGSYELEADAGALRALLLQLASDQ